MQTTTHLPVCGFRKMDEPRTSIRDYAACLVANPVYLSTWLAECVKQWGNWFTFVACYSVIQSLTDDPGVPVSLFLMSRRLPYLAWFTVSGFTADRANKGMVLVACCLLEGAVSLCLPLVHARQQLWWGKRCSHRLKPMHGCMDAAWQTQKA